MNALTLFQSKEFGTVRTVAKDEKLWFVAADVCSELDIRNNRNALSRLDADEKGVASIDTPGGRQQMAIVNEPGLYTLVLGSRKPEAKAFKHWIMHEVVPSIRRQGAYTIDEMLNDPDAVIEALQALKADRAKKAE